MIQFLKNALDGLLANTLRNSLFTARCGIWQPVQELHRGQETTLFLPTPLVLSAICRAKAKF